MQNIEVPYKSETVENDRIIGSYNGGEGPTIIVLGALHGNEPAGIKAFERVINSIKSRKLDFKGQLHGIRGNLNAIIENERFLDEDMNRSWHSFLERDENATITELAEDHQRTELLSLILKLVKKSNEPVIFFDLHSTSAPSLPFVAINDSIYNRAVVKDLPVPVILGLQEQIEGTLNGLLNDFGLPSILFEAGQHDDPKTIDFHESFLWYMIYRMGCILRNSVKMMKHHKEVLKNASKKKEGFYEVVYRHAIKPEDHFEMIEGFKSFQPLKNKSIVAKNKYGDIETPKKGLMFMPLYQSKGEDGYFLIQGIRPFWMRISKWLRHKNLDNYLSFLPGVSRLSNDNEIYRIDKNIAFAFALQVFHLLGYRKERIIDSQLIVSRIQYDDRPPGKKIFIKNLELAAKGKILTD